jgi:hypothetical protein
MDIGGEVPAARQEGHRTLRGVHSFQENGGLGSFFAWPFRPICTVFVRLVSFSIYFVLEPCCTVRTGDLGWQIPFMNHLFSFLVFVPIILLANEV